MTFGEGFAEAVVDYRMLLDRGYPVDASIRLVGDRHRLESAERMILFRGILSGESSLRNRGHLAAGVPAGARIAVDGYNVLFTVTNYLRGHPLFVSTDGFLRDAGGAHGRVADAAQFRSAAANLCESLASLAVASATVFLDAPISWSAAHAEGLREELAASRVPGEVNVVPSADPFVASWAADAVATSDSVIIANARAPVFDLARHLLESRYGASFVDLAEFLER